MRLQNLDLIAILARFSRETYRSLNATDLLTLNLVPRMCFTNYSTKGLTAVYCVPYLTQLGTWLGRRPETISRSTSKLQGAGLISKQRRRWIRGRRQSNIYRIGAALWRAISLYFKSLSLRNNDLTSKSCLVIDTNIINRQTEEKRSQTIKIKGPPEPDYISEMTKRHPEWQEIGGR